jgi:hypothetical protein
MGVSFFTRACMNGAGMGMWFLSAGLIVLCMLLAFPASKLALWIIQALVTI